MGSSSRAQGSILFAVVGAKLSEGINFADDMARCASATPFVHRSPFIDTFLCPQASSSAVRRCLNPRKHGVSKLIVPLLAGIPYPNSQSAELKERMSYLKTTAPAGRPSGLPDPGQVLCASCAFPS